MVFFFKLFRNCFALACLLLAWTNGGFILASGNAGSGNAAAPANRLPACPVSFLMDAVADARGKYGWRRRLGASGSWKPGTWLRHASGAGISPHHELLCHCRGLAGPVWVGTDNQGVLSGTAETWKTYDQLSGIGRTRVCHP